MTSIIKVDTLQKANGATPTAADLGINTTGTVLQVVSSLTSAFTSGTNADSSWLALSGLEATITPISSSSKILVAVHIGKASNASGADSTGDRQINFKLTRGSTDIGLGQTWQSRMRATFSIMDGPHHSAGRGGSSGSYQILDTPATTSATTYKVYGAGHAGEVWAVNRPAETENSADAPQSTTTSTITLTEIAG
jgi:hypothetical protein